MSEADPTLAERSRRHRANVAQRQAAVEAALAERVAALVVEALAPILAEALRNGAQVSTGTVGKRPASRSRGVDKPLRNRSDESADSATLRNGPDSVAGARVRGEAAPGPYGAIGAALTNVEEDAWRLLQVLTVPGSTGAIRDALGDGWPIARVTAALVYAQARGQVRREAGEVIPGQRVIPDRWVPTPEDAREEAAPMALHLDLDHPTTTVACRDYQAHRSHHLWDPALGAFVCQVCGPDPSAQGVAGTHPQGGGLVNGGVHHVTQ